MSNVNRISLLLFMGDKPATLLDAESFYSQLGDDLLEDAREWGLASTPEYYKFLHMRSDLHRKGKPQTLRVLRRVEDAFWPLRDALRAVQSTERGSDFEQADSFAKWFLEQGFKPHPNALRLVGGNESTVETDIQ